MQKTTTFLMFVGDQCGKAEEAINYYVSLFPNSEIKSIEKWKQDEPGGEEGLIKQASFTIAGQEYMASDEQEKARKEPKYRKRLSENRLRLIKLIFKFRFVSSSLLAEVLGKSHSSVFESL